MARGSDVGSWDATKIPQHQRLFGNSRAEVIGAGTRASAADNHAVDTCDTATCKPR